MTRAAAARPGVCRTARVTSRRGERPPGSMANLDPHPRRGSSTADVTRCDLVLKDAGVDALPCLRVLRHGVRYRRAKAKAVLPDAGTDRLSLSPPLFLCLINIINGMLQLNELERKLKYGNLLLNIN